MAYNVHAVASVMDQKIVQLEHVSNNLANSSTPGFKATHLVTLKNFQDKSEPDENTASIDSLIVDFARGICQETDNPLDLSIQSDGFFVVQTKEGEAFTRKGNFTINNRNQMITQEGDPVMGEAGTITLNPGKVHIGSDGSVFVDENQVGKLKIVDFTDRQNLQNTGGGLYTDNGSAGQKIVEQPEIASGSIELSNVNVINEMARMIDIHRSFEIYQKVIQALTEEDKLSVSRVGKV